MATNEILKQSLEHFRQQRQKKIDDMLVELRAIDTTIRTIQIQLGEPPDELSGLGIVGLPTTETPVPALGERAQRAYNPRADEFFQMSQAEAARTYLEKIGHAVPLEEILKAIIAGGCKVGGADPKRTLSIVLSQGKRDFVSTGGGNFGLRKFYNMPKLGRPEAAAQPKKKAKGKNSPKKPTKRLPKPKPEIVGKAYDKAAVVAAVAEVLTDNQLKTPDEVVKAVEKRVGFSVKKLAVYGMLRKKDFEQVGDKYRLRQPVEGSQVVQ